MICIVHRVGADPKQLLVTQLKKCFFVRNVSFVPKSLRNKKTTKNDCLVICLTITKQKPLELLRQNTPKLLVHVLLSFKLFVSLFAFVIALI